MEWLLELVLMGLLGATLFHAVRLERALGTLKRDRATLEELIAGFTSSTRQAEAGIERLRVMADGAGRQIARQAEAATALKGDLEFLLQRGETLADRLDALVRAGRSIAAELPSPAPPAPPASSPEPEAPELLRVRSQAERDLLKALRMAR